MPLSKVLQGCNLRVATALLEKPRLGYVRNILSEMPEDGHREFTAEEGYIRHKSHVRLGDVKEVRGCMDGFLELFALTL